MRYEFLIDRSERPQKCTILPLADERADFAIRRFERGKPIPSLTADVLLHVDGEPLDAVDRSSIRSLAFVDCNWRLCPSILPLIERPLPRLVRIPEGFLTAYPRRNKQDQDPATGLATIEAVYIAAAFCGVHDDTLLARYHWRREFLSLNAALFAHYGLLSHSERSPSG